jgi:hypothetical protein
MPPQLSHKAQALRLTMTISSPGSLGHVCQQYRSYIAWQFGRPKHAHDQLGPKARAFVVALQNGPGRASRDSEGHGLLVERYEPTANQGRSNSSNSLRLARPHGHHRGLQLRGGRPGNSG